MKKYIWKNSEYPNFTYDKDIIMPLLSSVRLKQGMLLGKMQSLGFENSQHVRILLAFMIQVIKIRVVKPLFLLISGRRGSNPRRQPWEGCILPLNYVRI